MYIFDGRWRIVIIEGSILFSELHDDNRVSESVVVFTASTTINRTNGREGKRAFDHFSENYEIEIAISGN